MRNNYVHLGLMLPSKDPGPAPGKVSLAIVCVEAGFCQIRSHMKCSIKVVHVKLN